MSVHPLVTQLRFARSEFARCMSGVTETDAIRRVHSLNCLSWIIGHLANQENYRRHLRIGRALQRATSAHVPRVADRRLRCEKTDHA